MKKLSENDFKKLPVRGKGRSSDIFNSLINLKVGEAILIETKDWKRKASPSSLVRYIEKKHRLKFHYSAIADSSGWAIKRIPDETETESGDFMGQKGLSDLDKLKIQNDITIYYLSRIGYLKIERIEDSLVAVMKEFAQHDQKMVKDMFEGMMAVLKEKGNIVIENEKAYIPLKRIA